MTRLFLLASLLVAQLAASPANAQPVSLTVGFPPGGGIDLLSRVLAEGRAARSGPTVVAKHRTGARSSIAAELLAKALPRGSVLGTEALGSTRADLAATIRAQDAVWRPVTRAANVAAG